MPDERFRRQLQEEAAKWRQEGLISEALWQQLVARYQLDQLTPRPQIFSTILYSFGGLFVGLAVITFVAANWSNLDRVSRLTVLLLLLVVTNTLGFYLWQYTTGFRRLGQGILLAAGLILGAVIALVAQTFNLSGPLHELFFAWSLGVLAMAVSLRLQTLGMLGLVLLGLGYASYRIGGDTANLVGEAMPYISVLLAPLAYWFDSRAVFVVVTLLWCVSSGRWLSGPLAFALPAVILWGYGESLRLDRLGQRLCPTARPMQPVARAFSLVLLGLGLTVYAFRFGWEVSPVPGAGLLLLVLAVYVALHQCFVRRDATAIALVGVAGVLASMSFIPGGTDMSVLRVVVSNLLLLVYSLGLVRVGTTHLRRGPFWLGMVLLGFQILSRLLEYDTGLMGKALGFGLGGLALVGAGFGFERHLARVAREPSP
ncbi:MAG: DUF2157 domain-containing protein [Gloeomargarita sp. SKYBB_i_bin120]|nr:DUF2157 domain-containing protein [Gloeomargarita sp. SKYG98]MCS7293105.1 DUF2157 domain-containing protein [Gloeomargarita sp. SKYB120]MDW8178670.1 DUF2157 domain-containing protein [Gloeomargarita sp. SKYBB_i_bin120]